MIHKQYHMAIISLLIMTVAAGVASAGGRREAEKDTETGSDGIYWATSNESGDFSDWRTDQDGEAVFNNDGPGNEVTISHEAARTGKYSVKMEVWDIDRYERGCRIFRWAEHLTEGYYSSWLMFPIIPDVQGWNNIFQVKKKDYDRNIIDPTFIHQISYDEELGGGQLTLDHWNVETDIEPITEAPVIMPKEWFHLEWYYRDGVDDGALKVWVNDELIWDLEGINTRGVDPDIQWGLALYGDRVTPGHHVMYADDHVIADHRVGSQYFGDSVPKLPLMDIDPYETKLDATLTEAIPPEKLNPGRYQSLAVLEVEADATSQGYDPAVLIDGDVSREAWWEADTGWQIVTYELAQSAAVSSVGIAWAFSDEQATTFSVETSSDGMTWVPVLSMAQSRLDETGLQVFDLEETEEETRSLRILGHFNDTGEWAQWISITEVKIYDDSGAPLEISDVAATGAQYPNVPENTLDGNTADESRWSAETDWREVQLTLDRSRPINAVALAFPFGDESRTQFDVYVSADTVSWDKIIADRMSRAGHTELLVYGSEVGSRVGKYLRIVPKFTTSETEPGRISISEIQVFGPSQ